MRCLFLAVVVCLLIAGCTPGDPSAPRKPTAAGVYISRQEYGEKWPFTVESGTLRRVDDAVVFESDADGKFYAVNGTAKSQRGWADIEPILALDSGPRGAAGYKKSVKPLIQRGLQLP